MRVFVVSDMEGVSAVVKWERVEGGETLYEEARTLYTEEINAAVRGAKAVGATEIVVMDCHGAGRVDVQLAPPRATRPRLCLRVHCDQKRRVAGLLVTGDDVTCSEATELLGPELVTVAVKQGLERNSARNLPPVRARALIEAAAEEAVAKARPRSALRPRQACEIVAVLASPDLADRYRYRHGVVLVDGVTIASQAEDWWTAWRRSSSDTSVLPGHARGLTPSPGRFGRSSRKSSCKVATTCPGVLPQVSRRFAPEIATPGVRPRAWLCETRPACLSRTRTPCGSARSAPAVSTFAIRAIAGKAPVLPFVLTWRMRRPRAARRGGSPRAATSRGASQTLFAS